MQKEQAESQANMGLALGIAVVFIFMVLASQFESLVHPFTIMLSLPLALVGRVPRPRASTGSAISMGSLIGLILLMGLVTKNAILLVDGALQHMRDDGDAPDEAIRKAGPRRLRPILMTSAAMVLGMLPDRARPRHGQRVPLADGDRRHRRRHHLDPAHAVGGPRRRSCGSSACGGGSRRGAARRPVLAPEPDAIPPAAAVREAR